MNRKDKVDETTKFGNYVINKRKFKALEKKKARKERKLTCLFSGSNAEQQTKKELKMLEKKMTKLQKQKLMFRCGPVTSNLDKILQKNKICTQAYHGRSFIGNHCNKYISDSVQADLCQSVINTAWQYEPAYVIIEKAALVQAKYHHLNQLFAEVHKTVGHSRPVSENNIRQADDHIQAYMTFLRKKFPDTSIIPKQHILENHVSAWMETWGFGMGLHGEQGGEQIHADINRMKHRAWSIKNILTETETHHDRSLPSSHTRVTTSSNMIDTTLCK